MLYFIYLLSCTYAWEVPSFYCLLGVYWLPEFWWLRSRFGLRGAWFRFGVRPSSWSVGLRVLPWLSGGLVLPGVAVFWGCSHTFDLMYITHFSWTCTLFFCYIRYFCTPWHVYYFISVSALCTLYLDYVYYFSFHSCISVLSRMTWTYVHVDDSLSIVFYYVASHILTYCIIAFR